MAHCDQCHRYRSGQFLTADCNIHFLCTTCSAVFLDGNSSMPRCSQCKVKEIINIIMNRHKIEKQLTKQRGYDRDIGHIKKELNAFTFNVDVLNKNTKERFQQTLPELSELNDSTTSIGVNNNEPNYLSDFIKFNYTPKRSSVCIKQDPVSGKMVHFFPFTPKSGESKAVNNFNEVAKKEAEQKSIVEKLIPTNYRKGSCASDISYVDNLFAFLREEKSKHQNLKVPSIATNNSQNDREFQLSPSRFHSDGHQDYSPCKPRQSPPVMTTLLKQIEHYPGACQRDSDTIPDPDDGNYFPYDTLTVRGSISPASDVKGEYGSEYDKQSVNTNSDSGSIEDLSDSNSRSSRSDGVKCPMPVFEQAFDGREVTLDELEIERGMSPCKEKKHSRHCSSGWLLDALPEPTPHYLPEDTTDDGEEEEGEDLDDEHNADDGKLYGLNYPNVIDASSYTAAELIYLDDEK